MPCSGPAGARSSGGMSAGVCVHTHDAHVTRTRALLPPTGLHTRMYVSLCSLPGNDQQLRASPSVCTFTCVVHAGLYPCTCVCTCRCICTRTFTHTYAVSPHILGCACGPAGTPFTRVCPHPAWVCWRCSRQLISISYLCSPVFLEHLINTRPYARCWGIEVRKIDMGPALVGEIGIIKRSQMMM